MVCEECEVYQKWLKELMAKNVSVPETLIAILDFKRNCKESCAKINGQK